MRSIKEVKEFAAKYNLSKGLCAMAAAQLNSGMAMVIVISGRLGSGKDTVAPLVLQKLGRNNAVHEYFAKPLKDEITEIIQIAQRAKTRKEAISASVERLQAPEEQVSLVVERLWNDVKTGEVENSHKRTLSTRFALQFWGTEVRRHQDENYWIKKAIASTVKEVSEGRNVYITDARFENEIDALTELGATTVRLTVSEKIQRERIFSRDGLEITEEAKNHISESALDSYEDNNMFEIIVQTDDIDANGVSEFIVERIQSKRKEKQ